MRKISGFTLIELVIVIVILGILGAVAAPRFINMQDDAYTAKVEALGSAIHSATTLAHTKAILGGYDKGSGIVYTDADFKKVDYEVAGDFSFVRGYPTASKTGIIAMLQNSEYFNIEDNVNSNTEYIIKSSDAGTGAGKTIQIKPHRRGIGNQSCKITYKAANKNNAPVITVNTKKC